MGILPKLKSSPEKPAYVPSATHMLPTFSSFNLIPMMAAEMSVYNALKHLKQRARHPPNKYIAECRAEWEAYIRQWKKDGMIDGSKPDPPYPYTEEMVQGWIDRTNLEWMRKQARQQQQAAGR